MSRPIQIGIRVLAASVIGLVVGQGLAAQADPTARADAWIRQQLAARKIPGMSVAVVRDGRIVFQRAYGLANVELKVPVTTATRFIIASTTKAWASTAILMLVEQGKVGLDQPITADDAVLRRQNVDVFRIGHRCRPGGGALEIRPLIHADSGGAIIPFLTAARDEDDHSA